MLFQQMSQNFVDEDGVSTVFQLIMGRLRDIFVQLRDPGGNPSNSRTTLKLLIQQDWRHALSMSLFYGRRDGRDPPKPRNGAYAQPDLFLTRIIQEYTRSTIGEPGVFPESVQEYMDAHKGELPKAPPRAANGQSFAGSQFQSRTWHVLNVFRCALELLHLEVPDEQEQDDVTIDETVQMMFFHAFSSLALSIGVPEKKIVRDHRLVWYLAVVLDKTFKSLQATLREEASDSNPIPRAFGPLLKSWQLLIADIAATHLQERKAAPAQPVSDTLKLWAASASQ